MKINTSKYILVLFLLFIGVTNTRAAYNGDCLLDVFKSELKEKNSKGVHDYFLNKTEENSNKAFQAWEVLYKADKNVDRLDIDNIEIVFNYMNTTKKKIDELVLEIKSIGGFTNWKGFNFKYKFQQEGYVYTPETEIEANGTKIIEHYFIKENEDPFSCGISSISVNGILDNDFRVPKGLKRKGMSKAIYELILKEDVKSITTDYSYGGEYTSDNYLEFMKAYTKTNDPVKAALETPQGKIIGKDWEPTKIKIDIQEKEVSIIWVKRGTKVESKPSNVIDLNTRLKQQPIKESYLYISEFEMDIDGTKIIEHFMKKENGEVSLCGISKISPNKVLSNMFGITKGFKTEKVFETIYNELLKEDFRSISSYYIRGQFPDEYTSFMTKYSSDNDKVAAALGTSEGILLSKQGWIPSEIKVEGAGVSLVWVKSVINKGAIDSWMKDLPTKLSADFSKDNGGLYSLFKNANSTQREKLTKSWIVLNETNIKDIKPEFLVSVSKIEDHFIYKKEKGFKALNLVFEQPLTNSDQKIELIQQLEKLNNMFDSNIHLLFNLSCVEGKTMTYKPIVIDGIGDEVIGIDKGIVIKNKFFKKIDESYKKVGEYNGDAIYRKEKEIGFKSADVININSNRKK